MTYPDSFGAKNGRDTLKNPGVNYKPFALHDTNEVKLDGYRGREDYPRGFIVDVSGEINLVSIFDEETAIPVIAGVLYPLKFKIAKATGTSGPTKVIAIA